MFEDALGAALISLITGEELQVKLMFLQIANT
jgi:hypothetical protein